LSAGTSAYVGAARLTLGRARTDMKFVTSPGTRGPLPRTAGLVMLAVIAAGLGGCAVSSGGSHATASGLGHSVAPPASNGGGLEGGLVVSSPVRAPTLRLVSYAHRAPVSISSMRGRAVFVTFVYTHCPDVCPLIVSELAAAQRALGAAAREARFVAVTVDPRRDTPAAVRAFLAARGALGRVDYLLGTRPAVARVWRAWHVTIAPGGDGTLAHSSVVYGISGRGLIRIAYPANFTPKQIVHDVPLLARS